MRAMTLGTGPALRRLGGGVANVLDYDAEAEMAVLGAMLRDGGAARQAAASLTATEFHVELHRLVFRILQGLCTDQTPIDHITVRVALEESGDPLAAEGVSMLADLLDAGVAAANWRAHAEIVRRKAKQRSLCQTATTLVERVRSGAPLGALREEFLTALLEHEAEGSAGDGHPDPICLLDTAPSTPVPWLAEGLVLANEPTLIVGAGGSFKSSLLLAIAGAIAGGYPVFGRFPTGDPQPVLLVSEEDGLAVVQNRLDAICTGMGWDRDVVLDNVKVHPLAGVRIDDPEWQKALVRQCRDHGVRLLCLDPLADLLLGSENSPDDARPVVQFWRRLNAMGVAVVVCHHMGKPKEGYTKAHRVRGASSWVNAARACFEVKAGADRIRLTTVKLSRSSPKGPIDIAFSIVVDPSAPATWRSARFEVAPDAHVARSTLSPSALRALRALDGHRSALQFTSWMELAGVGKSALSVAISTLKELGYIEASQTDSRGGKPVYEYAITEEGRRRLADSATPHATPDRLLAELDLPDSATPPPLLRGVERELEEAHLDDEQLDNLGIEGPPCLE